MKLKIPPPKIANKASMAMNGNTNAPAKGQPSIAPMPNHIIPLAVLRPPVQSINEAVPSMAVYMAKLDGRYAFDA
jgi:hypothetical protein